MLGFGTLAKKVFGTPNDRKIKATRPLIEKINALEVSVLTETQSVPEAFIAHAWERIGDRATNIAEAAPTPIGRTIRYRSPKTRSTISVSAAGFM